MKPLNASSSWATLALRGWVFSVAFCCTFLPAPASAQWTQTDVDSVVSDTSVSASSLEQLLRFFRTDIYPPGLANIPQIPSLLQQIASGQNVYSSDLSDILRYLADIYSASSSIADDASIMEGILSSYLPYLATESTLQDVDSKLSNLSGLYSLVNTIESLLSARFDSSLSDLASESTLLAVLSAIQSSDGGSSNVVNALADLQGLLESSTGLVSHVVVDQLPEISVSVTNQSTYDDRWIKRFLTGTDDGSASDPPVFRYSGGNAVGTGVSKQSLQDFLSHTLGIFEDTSSYNANTAWENAFPGGYVSQSSTRLGRNYGMFTYWLAEAMRRSIATNQFAVTQIDMSRRAITENQSLLLTAFRDAFDDSQVSNTVSDATSDTESDIEDDDEAAQDELDDLYDPEDNTDYVPDVDLEDIGDSQQLLGLGNQSSGNHSAIITLVHRGRAPGLGGGSSGILPPVEIDLGRHSSLVSGLDSLSDFLDYIYAAVFGLLLAVKGLHMWRVCHTASTAAAVGEQPVISLGWNPF